MLLSTGIAKILPAYWADLNNTEFIFARLIIKMKSPLLLLFFCAWVNSFAQQSSSTVSEKQVFGKIKWQFKTDGKIFSSPVIAGELVMVGSLDGNLYAVNIRTGKFAWKFHSHGAIQSAVAQLLNNVYVLSYDSHLYAVDLRTGRSKWPFKTGGEKKIGARGTLEDETSGSILGRSI
ncbi:MAG: hypothetical protein C5B59_18275 [Bacteroidetes bacterium]|nr:MAG: hypothetical protein C5B59_18275 [Bacteroidota bacterium]